MTNLIYSTIIVDLYNLYTNPDNCPYPDHLNGSLDNLITSANANLHKISDVVQNKFFCEPVSLHLKIIRMVLIVFGIIL